MNKPKFFVTPGYEESGERKKVWGVWGVWRVIFWILSQQSHTKLRSPV